MTWTSTTSQTRRKGPSHLVWQGSVGQLAAVQHLIHNGTAALWADPGAGKTSITLTAFDAVQRSGVAQRMLIMATVRICQLTWKQEAAKWSHTRHLQTVFLHGPKKDKILEDALRPVGLGGADICLINYEGLPWLCAKFPKGLPWDTIVSDEITKLKNAQGVRHKALRKVTKNTPRKWGLTGTPAPNGYLNLFGQFLWLDEGASLGRFYSHYRDNFFQPDFDGFNYKIQKGGEARIHDRIKDIVFRLEYTDLPAVRNNDVIVQLDPTARKSYDTMKKEMLLNVEGAVITASNSAAVYGKLKQMANGAVYKSAIPGQQREWVHVHDAKLDALCELIESLNGQPCLIAYQFNHDLERIQARLKKEFGWDVPYLGAGVSGAQAEKLQDEWNANKHPAMLCQPQSVAHGLNFQQGGAWHIIWFSADWDLENYEQLIRRLRRKGNTAERVMNHRLIVENSIDGEVFSALGDKDVTQARLLQGMRRVMNDEPTPHREEHGTDTEDDMTIRRLPAQGSGQTPPVAQPQQNRAPAPQPEQERARIQPKGWGGQATTAPNPQTTAIQSKLQNSQSAIPPSDPEPVYVAPVEEIGNDIQDAATEQMNAAMSQAISAGDEVREEVRAANDGEAPAPVAVKRTRRTAAQMAEGKAVVQQDVNRFAPSEATNTGFAEPGPVSAVTDYGSAANDAHVSINFSGSPTKVAQAMLQLISAFKAA